MHDFGLCTSTCIQIESCQINGNNNGRHNEKSQNHI